jgi:heat shock protein HslJ
MMAATLAPVLVVVASLGGAFAQAATLEGTAWTAVELYGTAIAADWGQAERRPHVIFGPAGRPSGADGCNRVAGSYALDGDGVRFGAIAASRMACPDTGDVPDRFHAALKGTGHWRIADGRLYFYGATGGAMTR